MLLMYLDMRSSCQALTEKSHSLFKYQGELSVDAVIDWTATYVLGLPRILYYSKETLKQKFFANVAYHKVKILLFSSTGERAAPFLRKLALEYLNYVAFANILWTEEDSQFWWNSYVFKFELLILLLVCWYCT